MLPTANLWQLVVDCRQTKAVNHLLQICPGGPLNRPELVFPDRESLLEWCPALHPKLDNLMVYHQRALTVIIPAGPRVPLALTDQRGEVAVRLALDSFCYRLCEDLEGPLAACHAVGAAARNLPTRFGRIRSDVVRAADFTVTRRQREELGTLPAVRVRLNAVEEIEFVE